jgi:hypothetical protein
MRSFLSKASAALKPKRRWFQYRLRTLLLLMTVVAVWMGFWADRARRQEQAVNKVQELGGHLAFAFQFDSQGNWKKNPKPKAPAWVRNAIGEHYFLSVTILNFDEGSDPTDEDLTVLRDLPDLRELTLMNGRRITDQGLMNISELKQLRVLALNGTGITGSGLRHIRSCRELEGLTLDDTPLTDQGLAHLEQLPKLEWLHLSNTKVTDKGLTHLTHLESLEDLQIRNTNVTDEGLEYLAKLTRLKCVLLGGTRVTSEGCARLQQALPNCRVSH